MTREGATVLRSDINFIDGGTVREEENKKKMVIKKTECGSKDDTRKQKGLKRGSER